ncbi:GFA family protein [Bradyrhizobium sp. CB82]|uniref:GFA family protein n=1 Tax=Bradyrhizobium sp. CB82 TaxID=3039159 RepID=UPI0024B1FD64|nr:GFA family protein [Bradyrhizobium sp. CB82]WFU44462.1 GFA family protein [Bradyrhizobium sp. CB82]
MTERTGGCACGAIRFRITAPLMGVGVCHCTDCQKASGGGPNYVALAPITALEVTKGDAKLYSSKGGSGEDVGRGFCPDCGTSLWGLSPKVTFATIKLGALDHNSDLTPDLHLYTSSAQPWHLMHEGLPTFPKMPPSPPPGV